MTTIIPACPDTGAWRAWLDQEDRSPSLIEHLQGCARCESLIAELRAEAADVREALSLLAPNKLPNAAEIALAGERLDWRRRRSTAPPIPLRSQESIPMLLSRISLPWRVAASGLAAALALSLLVAFAPGGQPALAAFLAQFRSQGVSAVEISPQSQADIVRTMNALGNLGTVTMPGQAGRARPEAAAHDLAARATTVSLAEAATSVGFALQTPDPALLPAGLDRTPRVQVMPATQVRFTFDKAKALAYFQSTGHAAVAIPDKFDGATLVVSMPSAAMLQYGNTSSREALVIGQAGELVVDVEGGKVSLSEFSDWFLGLPGLPADVVKQVRQITSSNDTLPIPIPIDKVNWQKVTIQGNQGLLLNDNSGAGSAAIWHANGQLYGIVGSIKATELQKIAETMKVRN